MSAATVNFETYTDADFSKAFMLRVGDTFYFDFTGYELMMMVRKHPDDVEVFVSLSTAPGDGIELSEAADGTTPGQLTTINILIRRDQFVKMPAGEYVHSLIMVEQATGLHDDVWRGTITHAIGPTR
jgi:hypothetical protein